MINDNLIQARKEGKKLQKCMKQSANAGNGEPDDFDPQLLKEKRVEALHSAATAHLFRWGYLSLM